MSNLPLCVLLFRGWGYKFWIFFFVLVSSPAFSDPTPKLSFDTLTLKDTGQITFTVFPSTEVAPSGAPLGEDRYSYASEDDEGFIVFVDPTTITPVPPLYNAFTFVAGIKRKRPENASWNMYNVRADPVGKFPDVVAKVAFKIVDGKKESTGSVRLPVHCATYEGDLIWNPTSPIMEVKVSDTNGPNIELGNGLETLPINISKVEIRSGCTRCWNPLVGPNALNITIPPSTHRPVPLQIKPRALSAMLATALKLKPATQQDTLTAVVSYTVDQGGMPKERTIDIPVRFSPAIWEIILATLIGGIVGLILKRFLAADTEKLTLSTTLVQVFLIAPLAVLITAIAASYDTKVVLLTFDMDPRQVIPAALIAFLATGGPTVTKWALGHFHQTDTEPEKGKAAGAGKGGKQ